MKRLVKGIIAGIILFLVLNVVMGMLTKGLNSDKGDYFFMIKALPTCTGDSLCSITERANLSFLIIKIIIVIVSIIPIIVGWRMDKKRGGIS